MVINKQITPYLLNKAFLTKSVNQNPRNERKELSIWYIILGLWINDMTLSMVTDTYTP